MARVTWHGEVRVTWHGDEVATEYEKKLLDGAETWLRVDVETDAKKFCPVGKYPPGSGKTGGTMRNTHTVQRGEREVVLGVGGPAAPYAEKQHEDANLRHHDGQESHWLENAAKRQIDQLPKRLKESCSK
jgi:hypothetical protein